MAWCILVYFFLNREKPIFSEKIPIFSIPVQDTCSKVRNSDLQKKVTYRLDKSPFFLVKYIAIVDVSSQPETLCARFCSFLLLLKYSSKFQIKWPRSIFEVKIKILIIFYRWFQ